MLQNNADPCEITFPQTSRSNIRAICQSLSKMTVFTLALSYQEFTKGKKLYAVFSCSHNGQVYEMRTHCVCSRDKFLWELVS